MSHRDNCPSRREAERRGERDYEMDGYRSYSTPYDRRYGDEGCPEAARAYADGQRHAEYRAEEEALERRSAEARRDRERMELQQQWEYESEMQQRREEEEYYAFLEEISIAEMEIAELHSMY